MQLRCSLINRSDTRITSITLDGIVHHEARSAVNLERIIGILVAILRIHPLCQGSQGVGQFIVGLHFGTFLGSQFPLARNIFKCLVNVDGTGTMVEQCAAGIELRLDRSQHIVNGGHFNDCFTELLTVTSVRQPFVVGGLGQTH